MGGAVVLFGCSSSANVQNGSGGVMSSGGQTGSGGSSSSGGTSGTGGATTASGGSGALGGSNASGGKSGSGGATATGGASAGGESTGGASAGGESAGGASAGGASAGGRSGQGGSATGGAGTTGSGGLTGGSGGSGGTTGAGGSTGAGTLPGDIAKAAGTPMVAAHSMTRAMFASYTGPLFKAVRVSDKQEKDIGTVAGSGLVDTAALNTFCAGTSCKVGTLYDQSGNSNDMWRGDTAANAPMDNGEAPKLCDLMDVEYWQMSDGTKIPIALEKGWNPGEEWKSKSQCLRNRDKTKNMPTGSKPQTEYGIFHQKYLNPGCCFNYGNTGKKIHYTGPGTLSALNFSKVSYWSKGTGTGPWVEVDFETGVYAGNIAKCNSGAAAGTAAFGCTATGQNPNPTVLHDIVTALFKHDGVKHWALKAGNAKTGALAVSIDLPTLPQGGYSPLKQEGGLGLGEGGAGDAGGSGGFSEGAVIAGETTDATDDAIQKSIVSVFGK
jgi:non-reducing end alpha-L-arabinofuranosidase